ncbi:fibroblast growth factor receptor substrate 3 [Folsomia candida]|nr:fibroblast growth factor receptor substrate 3 [Folsomia candida]
MGCIGSKLAVVRNRGLSGSRRSSLRRQNVFPVLNVDDMGRQISPGKLEVTETDLVLHVRGKPSLTWPLRCLRRYGYDNDLFSFESGRRCPTGAGIFAFRCNRAQSLFNLLQSKIQGNPGTTPNTVPSTPITPTCSNNPSTPVSSTFVYVNLAENSSNRQTSNNAPDVTQVAPNSQAVPPSTSSSSCSASGGGGSVAPGTSSFPSSQSQKMLNNNCHPLYMNVEGLPTSSSSSQQHHNAPAARASSIPYQIPTQNKSQYSVMNHERRMSGQFGASNSSSSGNTINPTNNDSSLLYTNVVCSPNRDKVLSAHYGSSPFEPAEINYAELDLKTDNCSSSSTNPLHHHLSSGKGRFFLGGNKENGKPMATLNDSKFRLKLGSRSSPIRTIGDPLPLHHHPSSLLPHQRNLISGGRGGGGIVLCDGVGDSTPANNGELGYATIDFDRTAALSVVTRSKINLECYTSGYVEDHPTRKTRHNSTAL